MILNIICIYIKITKYYSVYSTTVQINGQYYICLEKVLEGRQQESRYPESYSSAGPVEDDPAHVSWIV